jgi:hypothetical protein
MLLARTSRSVWLAHDNFSILGLREIFLFVEQFFTMLSSFSRPACIAIIDCAHCFLFIFIYH